MTRIKATKWQRINTEFLGISISGFGLVVNGMVYAVNEWGGKCTQIGNGGAPAEMLLWELEEWDKGNYTERLFRNWKKDIEKEFGSPYLD